MDLIKTLNENAGAAQVLLSGLLIAATFVYVWFTKRMWSEMRETNRRLTEPVIFAGFEPGHVFRAIYDLVVRNDGPTDAYKVKVTLSRCDLDEREKLQDLVILKKGLPFLATRQEFRTIAFDLRSVVAQGKHQQPVAVTVEYHDAASNVYRREYAFDLAVLAQQSSLVGEDVHSIGREIKDMQDDTRAIRAALESLRVGLDYAAASLPRRADRPADPQSQLRTFMTIWVDHRTSEPAIYWVEFVMYRLRLLCRTTYEALTESERPEHKPLRQLLLQMGEQRSYLDGGRSRDAFVESGDRVVRLICEIERAPNPLLARRETEDEAERASAKAPSS